ncbi:MAG: hypothetical protein WKF66_20610 [Pedobacter sp.]
MKRVILFVLSFLLISALPFLWNQFSFVEAGFPFAFVKRSVIEVPGYSQSVYSYVIQYLVYDLILIAVSLWLFTKIRAAAKNRS